MAAVPITARLLELLRTCVASRCFAIWRMAADVQCLVSRCWRFAARGRLHALWVSLGEPSPRPLVAREASRKSVASLGRSMCSARGMAWATRCSRPWSKGSNPCNLPLMCHCSRVNTNFPAFMLRCCVLPVASLTRNLSLLLCGRASAKYALAHTPQNQITVASAQLVCDVERWLLI